MRIALVPLWFACLGLGMAQAAPDKFSVTPEEHAACDGDAMSLCSDTYPDPDKLLACMKAHRSQLTPTCLDVFQAGLRRRHIPI